MLPSLSEPPRPHDCSKAFGKGGTVVGIVVLVAVGPLLLVVGTIYLSSSVGLDF
jgi:hypothetical protein